MEHSIVLMFVLALSGLSLCKNTLNIDERWVCNIKTTCLDCLSLPQCSWCAVENRCFSRSLPNFEDFCESNATHYVDYGMSLEKNSKCACFGEELEQNCVPPGDSEAPECSNRGKCECGRCVCDTTPDPDHPTKTIMGEFCEFDNFSCDGPRCNEGPYNINQIDDDLE